MTTVIKPMIRNNIALNAHPQGCRQLVKNYIEEAKSLPLITDKNLNVLIIGGSSGYGLATRINLAFNAHAYTYNVSFEREARGRNTASAGYYNNRFFAEFAQEENIPSDDLNIDAFSHNAKNKVIEHFKSENKKIDLVVYSVASGIRIDPDTQEKYTSSLKPILSDFKGYSVDIAKEALIEESLECATEEEISSTIKVMGGEDYLLWIQALDEAGLLAPKAKSITYTYMGSDITYPIYKEGTIGHAKRDLESTNMQIQEIMKKYDGEAIVSSSKTVVTKASVFIPTVALYASALFKVMQENGTHESIIKHKHRLFHEMVYGGNPTLDQSGLYRLDAHELDPKTQAIVSEIMNQITPDNFKAITDFELFKQLFLEMNGFSVLGVDYQLPTDSSDF